MDWDKLRVFHAVAEAGSFTHAGHDLGLSQSAISRQIAALEHELKVPLFHRHARGLILTEQGEVLYRTAHEVHSKLAAARTRLTDSREKPTGELRITTTIGLGTIWLTPRISEFIELYPQISVVLLLDDRELDLAMREADIAIRLRRPVQPDLIQRKLFTVHHHVYASAEYVRRFGMPKTLDDLDRHTIITFGTLPRRHAQGAVEADGLAVEHVVVDDVGHQAGVFLRLAEARGKRDAVAQRLAHLLGQSVHHRGGEQPRQNGDAADAVAGEVARHGQRQARHPALGRRIGHLADLAVAGRDRGGVDDHPAAAVGRHRVEG
jgi:DNA-binding transcriptional LysR family regulator